MKWYATLFTISTVSPLAVKYQSAQTQSEPRRFLYIKPRDLKKSIYFFFLISLQLYLEEVCSATPRYNLHPFDENWLITATKK